MSQKLSDLMFVLLFDADALPEYPVPSTAYYVLPGHETDYKDPKQIIADIIAIVADGIAIGSPPAGMRRGLLNIEHSLKPAVLWGWNLGKLDVYHDKGFNPIKYRMSERSWVVWGQDYYNRNTELARLVVPEYYFKMPGVEDERKYQLELA